MEHNIEFLIRQKVKEADSFPVTWRKDLVWQQVSLPVKHKLAALSYYTAAAALVMGLGLLYFLQSNQQELREARIISLELAIQNKLELNSLPQNTTVSKQDICDPVSRLVPATTEKHFTPFSNMKKNPTADPRAITPAAENVSPTVVAQVDAEIKDPLPTTTAAIAPETPLVNPIIGYIPIQSNVKLASKKIKKSKIRFLKSPEPELASQVAESKWTIARIN